MIAVVAAVDVDVADLQVDCASGAVFVIASASAGNSRSVLGTVNVDTGAVTHHCALPGRSTSNSAADSQDFVSTRRVFAGVASDVALVFFGTVSPVLFIVNTSSITSRLGSGSVSGVGSGAGSTLVSALSSCPATIVVRYSVLGQSLFRGAPVSAAASMGDGVRVVIAVGRALYSVTAAGDVVPLTVVIRSDAVSFPITAISLAQNLMNAGMLRPLGGF